MIGEVPHLLLDVPQPGRPTASYITTAGWMKAASTKFGSAVAITPAGRFSEVELTQMAVSEIGAPLRGPQNHGPARRMLSDLTSPFATTRQEQRFRTEAEVDLGDQPVPYVWERHSVGSLGGRSLADRFSRPLVLSVHALAHRQAVDWGRTRPFWKTLERYGELPAIRRADAIACVSGELLDTLRSVGMPEAKLIHTPNGVDCSQFNPSHKSEVWLESAGLADNLRVFWAGSFRPFHGLSLVLRAFAKALAVSTDSVLVLAGDGPARRDYEQLAFDLGIADSVRFLGAIPYSDMGMVTASMDIGLLASETSDSFHYSPVKLREYLASGLAVVAPALGDLSTHLEDGRQATLVSPGSSDAIADALIDLLDDFSRRQALGSAGRAWAESNASWETVVERVVDSLTARGCF